MSEDFFMYPAQDTDPTLPVMPEDELARQAGVDPNVLARTPLHEYEVPPTGIMLDPQTMPDLDGNGLLGIVQVGQSAVKIYNNPLGSESATPAFCVASHTYDPTRESDGNARRLDFAIAYPGNSVTAGRQTTMAARLGIKEDMQISREHFMVSATPDGKLIITDLGSTNGTRFIAAERKAARTIGTHEAHQLGELVTPGIIERPAVAEKNFGGVTVQLNGRFVEDHYNGYILTTIDDEGRLRKMFAYQSQSEGGWRISPGIELLRTNKGVHRQYLKGASDDQYHQYTQDSQMHPAVLAAFEGWLREAGDTIPVVGDTEVVMEKPTAEITMKDFASERQVEALPDAKVAEYLAELRVGELGKKTLARTFNVPEAQVPQHLEKYVEQLNDSLEQSGLLPDFHRPVWRGRENHPRLGPVVREIFVHSAQGRKYEWDMVADEQGRVWIDRIRDVAARPNAYGGDDRVVFSGILTCKPMDYTDQVSGLPAAYREAVPNSFYTDITRFLDTLAPIKHYRQQRSVTAQY